MNISLSFDVEEDLHSPTYNSLKEGIPQLLNILDKYKIKATFFVPAKLIEKFPSYFLNLKKQKHGIALHGYKHERFDNLSRSEAEKRIEKSVKIYKKIFRENPKGFRAPQHSIDEKTLEILSQNNFHYDSSYTPLNFLQLFFFPKAIHHELKGFSKPRSFYKISKSFYEIPISSIGIPLVSFPVRILPWFLLKIYLEILRLTHKNLVFYAHSWDFIDLPKSKIDRMFSHKRLIKNFERMIGYLSKRNNFIKLEQLAKSK